EMARRMGSVGRDFHVGQLAGHPFTTMWAAVDAMPVAPAGGLTPAIRLRRRPVTGAAIDADAWPTRAFVGFADVLRRYHRPRVGHLARLERALRSGRRVLLVGNHALDIVDPLLLLATVFDQLHRVPTFIGHENGWFRLPVLRNISAFFPIIPSR